LNYPKFITTKVLLCSPIASVLVAKRGIDYFAVGLATYCNDPNVIAMIVFVVTEIFSCNGPKL
jgi:hypothetical protein